MRLFHPLQEMVAVKALIQERLFIVVFTILHNNQINPMEFDEKKPNNLKERGC